MYCIFFPLRVRWSTFWNEWLLVQKKSAALWSGMPVEMFSTQLTTGKLCFRLYQNQKQKHFLCPKLVGNSTSIDYLNELVDIVTLAYYYIVFLINFPQNTSYVILYLSKVYKKNFSLFFLKSNHDKISTESF